MIYAHATAGRLALVRIAVFTIWLIDLATDPIPQLAELPRAWFTPHGPWVLAPDALVQLIWDPGALLALKLATLGVVSLALLGAPGGGRLWAALACVALTLVTAFVRGFGHADHAQLQLLFLTFALPFLPAWDAFCLRRSSRPSPSADAYPASFVALSLVFAFPYFMTAVYRLSHEGAAIFLGNSMLHFIARDAQSLDHLDFVQGIALLDYSGLRPVLNVGFALVTLAELTAPLVYLRAPATLAWLAVIVPFHLLAPVIMHVLFAHNLALLIVLYAWPLCWRFTTRARA